MDSGLRRNDGEVLRVFRLEGVVLAVVFNLASPSFRRRPESIHINAE